VPSAAREPQGVVAGAGGGADGVVVVLAAGPPVVAADSGRLSVIGLSEPCRVTTTAPSVLVVTGPEELVVATGADVAGATGADGAPGIGAGTGAEVAPGTAPGIAEVWKRVVGGRACDGAGARVGSARRMPGRFGAGGSFFPHCAQCVPSSGFSCAQNGQKRMKAK